MSTFLKEKPSTKATKARTALIIIDTISIFQRSFIPNLTRPLYLQIKLQIISCFQVHGRLEVKIIELLQQLIWLIKGAKMLQDCQFVAEIGKGAYGKVYLVRQESTGLLIAVKTTFLEQDVDKYVEKTITPKHHQVNEEIHRLLGFYAFSEVKSPFIELYFEYMSRDLKNFIQIQDDYGQQKVRKIMWQIVKGLNYMHDNKVLHRDIKPQNILINNNGDVKIADLGLGRIIGVQNEPMSYEIGTQYYIAPQLLYLTRLYDYSIDIWSLGCLFYELCERKVLFIADDEVDQIKEIISFCLEDQQEEINLTQDFQPNLYRIRPLKSRLTALCDDGIDLLEKMIRWNPKERILTGEIMKHPYFKGME